MTTVPANPAFPLSTDAGVGVPLWNRVAWGPIMTGAVCAIGLQFVFTVLGIAIGVSAARWGGADQATTADAQGISMAAGAWWLITGTIALFIGGAVFGRLAGLPRALPLKLEAMAMWAVVAVFGFVVVASGLGMATEAASPIAAMSMRTGNHMSTGFANQGMMGGMTGNGMTGNGSGMGGTGATTGTGTSASGAAAPTGTSTGTTGSDAGTTTSNGSSLRSRNDLDDVNMEDARRAARHASWWSVIGLLMGIGASIGGAVVGTPNHDRVRPHTP